MVPVCRIRNPMIWVQDCILASNQDLNSEISVAQVLENEATGDELALGIKENCNE